MKLAVLMENTTACEGLTCEHGLSLYLEANGRRILFDAGQTEAFADNAEKMGIDLRQVDVCVLSHGHYDHGGGMARFLAINDHAPVYLSRHAFGAHYNGTAKYIGLDPALMASERLIFTGDECILDENMALYSCNERARAFAFPPFGLNRLEGGQHLPEDFRHEQYLLIREGGRRILISGCSHKGIRNIAAWFAPEVLVGGFHLMKLDPKSDAAALHEMAEGLLATDTRYYTGHCTGEGQYAALKGIMGERLHALKTGRTFDI